MALPSEWIELVLARAGELRAAGVLELGADYVVFAPLVESPTADPNGKPPADEVIPHPLNDPHSYPDGIVPGFEIEKLEE